MSIACPHRHLSYSQWRLTVYSALFANVTQSPSTTGRAPIARGYRSRTGRQSTEDEKSRPEQPKAQAAKDKPTSKKWDPYSQQGRSDLRAVMKQLQEADFPQQPESADQLADLPQSPIINRTLCRRRQRPAKRQPTPEERALENDPWAAMLAHPVRMEIATRARLPTALMTNWGLVKRPETDDIYVLPDSLADLDSLDKMDRIADLDARQPGQEQAGRAELEAARTTEEKKSKQSTLLNPGTTPAIRLLPSAKLMERLTQLYTFVERPGSPSSPRIMRLSVDLTSILPQLWRERIARVRHYDWSQREVEAKTGNKDLRPPPLEATISKANLKWQPDIEHRLLSILRTRLAVCLKRVLHLAGTAGTSTASQSHRENTPVQLQPALLDLLKNRGESSPDTAHAVDNEAGLDPPAHRSSRLWGPYSPPRILLYFSDDPSDLSLQHLPPTNPLATIPGIKPTTYTDESETAQQKVPPLLPPLLLLPPSTNLLPLRHYVPILPMRALLDEPQYSALVQAIRHSTGDWLAWDNNSNSNNKNQAGHHFQRDILSVSADAACADVLFAEIWRLWRYVGGRQCMSETVSKQRQAL